MADPTPPVVQTPSVPAVDVPSSVTPLATRPLYDGIGEKRFTKEQEAIFLREVKSDDLDILPTGEVYLSQVQYRRRLNEAFGVGGWGLRDLGVPMMKDNQCIQQFALIAEGRFIAKATGHASYYPNNSRMGWGDALEAAKSNALMRCCKDLGIASECWDRRANQAFKKAHCIKVFCKRKNIWQWRLQEAEPFEDETTDGTTPDSTAAPTGTVAKLMTTKFPGVCRGCGNAIKPGDQIWYEKGQKPLCKTCGENPQTDPEVQDEVLF